MNRASFTAAVLIAASAFCLVSCDTTGPEADAIGGRYAYTAYNAADTAVVSGTINIVNPDTTALAGSWDLHSIRNAPDIGPQTGSGTLTGSEAGSVSINLNPSAADNNVFLLGVFYNRKITGTWQWITLSGVTAEGRFEMQKQ
jgi:hypothetical protein